MKLLFITTQFPYPMDNGGKIGALNGINVVSRDYDVTVLSFTEEPQYVEEGITFFQQILPSVCFENPVVHDVHIRKKPVKLIGAIAGGYIKHIPYISSKFDDETMYKKIDNLFIHTSFFDIVFIDYLNMNIYGEYIRKEYNHQYGHLILKDHNMEFDIVKQEASSSTGLKKLVLEMEWKRTLRYEAAAIQQAELVFSVCDSNMEFLKKYNINSWTMLPTYEIQLEPKKLPSVNSILYIGNLSWKSNLDGLCWFVEKVFPLIREQIPDATLTVVGSGMSQNLFENVPGVEYLGFIKDISHIYDIHKVFIVPLFEGSGIRIKILEAFNNEIAVVSTLIGCETIGATSGEQLMIVETAVDFSRSVVQLLRDDIFNERMRKKGKEFLKERFSLQRRQDEFADIVSNTFGE